MAVVTITRQYGTGGLFIARTLAETLGYTFFGARRTRRGMQGQGSATRPRENRRPRPTILERTFGVGRERLRDVLFESMSEAADAGNVVIAGWGGQVLLKDRADALHLRIVGSVEARIRHFMESSGVARTAAEETIRRTDRDQGMFYQYFFNVDAADSALYHGVLNIEQASREEIVALIELMLTEKAAS